jgi:hypothetical protein
VPIIREQLELIRSPKDAIARLASDPRGAFIGFRHVFLLAVLYELAIALWALGDATPTIPAFLKIPDEQYYYYELIFMIPMILIIWLLAGAIARSVVESQRGKHPEYVFTYKDMPLARINNHAWRKARTRAGVPEVRVHDLRHTFGHRLRASGVSFEDRQDLLGHRSGRITTHYSAPDISRLLDAVNSICEPQQTTVLRIVRPDSGNLPAGKMAVLE